MIRVTKADKPADFDSVVAQPGQIVLWELDGDPRAPRRPGPKRKELAELWTKMLPQMRILYERRCAYLALYIHRGTGRDSVDHFRSKNKDEYRHLSYSWDNYRYASLDVNRLKGQLETLDPCDVQDDWFCLDLEKFEIKILNPIPDEQKLEWDNTCKFINDPIFCDARSWYYNRYLGIKIDPTDPDEPMSLVSLEHEAPFVARELRRQGKLRPGDT